MSHNSAMLSLKEKRKRFGNNVAKLRQEKHLTQEQFAEMLDVGREHIGKVEIGKSNISLDLLYKMSEVFGVSESYFFMPQACEEY